MFKRLTNRLCTVYQMPADEFAALIGDGQPVRPVPSSEVVTTHHVHHVVYHYPTGDFPVPVEVTTTVIRGEIAP